MERVAIKMQLNQGMADEYRKRHDEIWPELKKLLMANGIHDYSIFLDEETHILFGVMKVESPEKLKDLPTHKIMQDWWKYMADIMKSNDDHSPVSVPLKEMFYLQ